MPAGTDEKTTTTTEAPTTTTTTSTTTAAPRARATTTAAPEAKASKQDVSPRSGPDEVPASAATIKDAVQADEARVGKPTAGPEPPLFIDSLGKHDETGRAQAAVASGDGTVNVWPPQPHPDNGAQTIRDGETVKDAR